MLCKYGQVLQTFWVSCFSMTDIHELILWRWNRVTQIKPWAKSRSAWWKEDWNLLPYGHWLDLISSRRISACRFVYSGEMHWIISIAFLVSFIVVFLIIISGPGLHCMYQPVVNASSLRPSLKADLLGLMWVFQHWTHKGVGHMLRLGNNLSALLLCEGHCHRKLDVWELCLTKEQLPVGRSIV